jgi:hypothetical protein
MARYHRLNVSLRASVSHLVNNSLIRTCYGNEVNISSAMLSTNRGLELQYSKPSLIRNNWWGEVIRIKQ